MFWGEAEHPDNKTIFGVKAHAVSYARRMLAGKLYKVLTKCSSSTCII